MPAGSGPDGGVFDVRMFAGRGRDDVVLLFQDVTEVAALEQRALQARNELALSQRALVEAKRAAEAANAAKSRFLGMISHDLKTPINVLMGNAEILRDEAAAKAPAPLPELRPFVDDILDSGRYLLQLIEDLLDLARGEGGALELDLEPVDPAGAMDEALRVVNGLPAAGDLALSCRAEPRLAPVLGDRRRIKQILVNLLTNAIRFTPAGGRVGVTASARADGFVALAVADSGIGIAEADLERVLEPFAQGGQAPVSGGDGGTGLGLSVARMLAERHGGTLSIESAPGVGTTVTVLLPTAAAARRRTH